MSSPLKHKEEMDRATEIANDLSRVHTSLNDLYEHLVDKDYKEAVYEIEDIIYQLKNIIETYGKIRIT